VCTLSRRLSFIGQPVFSSPGLTKTAFSGMNVTDQTKGETIG